MLNQCLVYIPDSGEVIGFIPSHQLLQIGEHFLLLQITHLQSKLTQRVLQALFVLDTMLENTFLLNYFHPATVLLPYLFLFR